jgi:hypothetical protein
VRTPVLLALLALLAPIAAQAGGEIDLTPRSRRHLGPPKLVLRAEGGNAFAPAGYVGGVISYLTDDLFEFEGAVGAGFPGVQFGFAARRLFGESQGAGAFFVFEIFLAGNPKVNRGNPDVNLNVQAATSKSSLWTGIGPGFEQRLGAFDLNIAADLVFTTADFTPHYALRGGIGFGF